MISYAAKLAILASRRCAFIKRWRTKVKKKKKSVVIISVIDAGDMMTV